jgi:Protein of unknown function (DUF1570)
VFLLPLATPLLAALLLPAFDKVLLKDGRTVEGQIVKGDDPTVTKLKIGLVEVPIRNDLIEKTYIESLEGYVPKNKQEEAELKKGSVLFEGTWMSRTRREGILSKRAESDKAAIAEMLRRQKWKNAVQEETRHFIVTSNCTDEIREEYESRLEAYYKYFTEDWGITLSPGEVRGKMKFFLYRDYDDFLRETGVPYGVGGFFNFYTGELQLYHNMEDPEETRDTLFHEGNHLLTFLIDTRFRYPTWLNEGMAEYYGTADIDAKGVFHVGGLQYGRIVSLRNDKANGKFLSLRDDILLIEQSEYKYRQYAYGWSFVHFMMASPKYGKSFKSFFAGLPKNQDIRCEQVPYASDRGTMRMPNLDDVVAALEKRFGASAEELEQQWLAYMDETYGELPAIAWYKAAGLAMGDTRKDGSHVKDAMEYLEKACTMGIEVAACYRHYAEMLRKGGVVEASDAQIVQPPDAEKAWAMIQKAISLDPIDPYNYAEAGGILILDSPLQDLDRAKSMCDTATALATKGNWAVKQLVDELLALIEPAREQRRALAEAEAEMAKNDMRQWHVAFWYQEPDPPPDNLADLSTQALRDLIRAGKVRGCDHVWQAWRDQDQETGELIEGTQDWDRGWVDVDKCPVFADDLAAAPPEARAPCLPVAPTAPGAGGSGDAAGGKDGGG